MTTATLAPGFADPVLSAQATFRAVMDAMAHPGRVYAIEERLSAPPPLSRAAAAIALALCDQDTPVWLDAGLAEADVAYWLRFHTGAPVVEAPAGAAFAILSDPEQAPPFEAFAQGTPEYPNRSATLILQVESVQEGPALVLSGPGVKGCATLRARPQPPDFRDRLAANGALFPRGVDLLLVTDAAVVGLPRSVRLADEA
jgi:alpha-D-ribose 1-methylphosphonate 5-triphosphate synthase subunit PhnH